MKLIKKINNNVALCIDSKGNEIIVTGKGIGFETPNQEIELKKIERTFYNLSPEYISLLNDISPKAFKVAELVLDFASDHLMCELNENVLFNLADHIDFAIERYHKNLNVKLPIYNDIEHLFDSEMKVGRFALEIVKNEYGIILPDDEAARIALNIINSEYNPFNKKIELNNQIVQDITEIIEDFFNISINRHSFSYTRFVTHMHYLFKRENENDQMKSINQKLYKSLITGYPTTYECVENISEYFLKNKNLKLSQEERFYLMLHINRLCDKEDK